MIGDARFEQEIDSRPVQRLVAPALRQLALECRHLLLAMELVALALQPSEPVSQHLLLALELEAPELRLPLPWPSRMPQQPGHLELPREQ